MGAPTQHKNLEGALIMKIKLFNIHKGERTFEATTKQANLFATFSAHGQRFAVTSHDFYWDTKTDKMRTKSMQTGYGSSRDNADLFAEIKGEWCKVRIFATPKQATLSQCVDECKEIFKDNLPLLAKRIEEISA